MEKIDSFVFYRSYFEATKDLKPLERLSVFESIFAYVFEKRQPNLKGIPSIILTMAIPNLDAAIVNRLNGKKGGRPKTESHEKRGVIKGGYKGGLKREVETNEDVNEDVNEDNFTVDSFDGKTTETSIVNEWQKELGITQFSEVEKMAIKELSDDGCIPEDAKKARLENPKYFGKIAGNHTRRLIVTQRDLRQARPKGNGLQFPF